MLFNILAVPLGASACLFAAAAFSLVISVIVPMNAAFQNTFSDGAMAPDASRTLATLTIYAMVFAAGATSFVRAPFGRPASALFAVGWFLAYPIVTCSELFTLVQR